MKCVIFANGIYNHTEAVFSILENSFIIAADAGLFICDKIGVMPDVIIGDMDSVSKTLLDKFIEKNVMIKRYPSEKDNTDMEISFRYAFEQKFNEIVVLGGLGKRWDMTFANVLIPSLSIFKDASITFIDDKTCMTILSGEKKKEFFGKKDDIFSIIPLSEKVDGVTLRGFKYLLKDASLEIGSTIGVSNLFMGEKAEVSIKRGRLLCVHSAN